MKPEVKPFRFFAKSASTEEFIIREAIRFLGDPKDNTIYALYYDDWNESVIKEPIYIATSEEDMKEVLANVAYYYSKNPDGLLDFYTVV